jgi:hypothetical protein
VAQEARVAPVVQRQVVELQQTPVQGDGVQTLAPPWKMLPPGQPEMSTAEQAHVRLSQQTPGQGVAHEPPQVNTFGVVHAAGAVTVQTPVTELQHLPVQGLGVQVPLQMKVRLEAVHEPEVALAVQAQVVLLQQTPRQGLGVQAPAQKNCLSAPVQIPAVEGLHAQVEITQQTPTQGLGVQVPLQKKVRLEAVQLASVAPAVHTHVVLLQQTPGHGLGVQTLAGPWYISPPAQPVTLTAAQAHDVMLQQTPGHGVAQVPLHVKTLGVVHVAGAVTLHAPVVALQHLPMQGVGVQVPPQKKMLGVAQEASVAPVVQRQVVELQQTPVQGDGVQTLAGPL